LEEGKGKYGRSQPITSPGLASLHIGVNYGDEK
jgi:hypothetical protein